jgi:hypothetical protein
VNESKTMCERTHCLKLHVDCQLSTDRMGEVRENEHEKTESWSATPAQGKVTYFKMNY